VISVLKFGNVNKFLKFVKFIGLFLGYVYIDSGIFSKKTHKQQHNAGPD